MNNDTEKIFLKNPPKEVETQDENEPSTSQINLENIEDFTNVCRTCAAVTEFVVPIFIGEGLQNKLADKIHKYLPIQVSEEDVLPQVVCYQCVSTLISWHDLVQNCAQADTALRNKLTELLADENSKIHEKRYDVRTKGKFKDSIEFIGLPDESDDGKICEYCGIRQSEEDYPEHLISMHSEDLLPFRERDPFQYVISDDDDEYEEEKPARKRKQTTITEKPRKTETSQQIINAGIVMKTEKSIPVKKAKKTEPIKNIKNTEPAKKKLQNNNISTPKTKSRNKNETAQKRNRNPRSSQVSKDKISYAVSMAFKDLKRNQRSKKPAPMEMATLTALPPSEVSEDLDAPLEINGPSKQVDNIEIFMESVDKLKIKRKIKSFRCKYCPRVFTVHSSYSYHMRNSHRVQEFECDMCNKKFRNKQILAQHITVIHEGKKKSLQCKYCFKTFSTQANLYCHEQIHLDMKKWPCTECSQSFRWRTHLLRHMKRHSVDRLLVCHTCGRRFNVLDDLRRHQLTHTIQHHCCTHCGRRFSQLRYLRVHMSKKHNINIPGN